jgi:hypothetical protein
MSLVRSFDDAVTTDWCFIGLAIIIKNAVRMIRTLLLRAESRFSN